MGEGELTGTRRMFAEFSSARLQTGALRQQIYSGSGEEKRQQKSTLLAHEPSGIGKHCVL